MEKDLLDKITEHLLIDDKPSEYIISIKDSLIGTPLQIIAELENVEQSKEHHPEGNVFNHIMLVVDKAAKLKELAHNKKELMIASLLHDIGKKEATKMNKKGRLISYDHDKIGSKIANDILKKYHINNMEREIIVNLVRYHMHHLYIINNLPYGNVDEMIKNVDMNDMFLLFVSDRLGRGQNTTKEIKKELKDIEKILYILKTKYNINLDIFNKIETILI